MDHAAARRLERASALLGTPWLTISGGPWFRAPEVADYGEDGPRTPSMTRARIQDDLDSIVSAAAELLAGTLAYDQALADYFAALVAAHNGNASAIWSIDGIHLDHVPGR